jgi:putative ATP-dependent endonuclease of the OLD family
MQLEWFSVSGFRSMAGVTSIPLRSPTILTGRNDSGKSATLDALAFLLGEYSAQDGDFRGTPDPPGSVNPEEQVVVTGEFTLSAEDVAATGLSRVVNARRVSVRGVARARYEVEQSVPEDARLRGLNLMTLAQLKETASALGTGPDGAANAKESFLRALRPLAAAGPHCTDWALASDELISRLPKYLRLSGADAADANAQLLTALRFTYRRILSGEDGIPLRPRAQRPGIELVISPGLA